MESAPSSILENRVPVAKVIFADLSHSGPGIYGSNCISRKHDAQKRHEIDWVPSEQVFDLSYFDPGSDDPICFSIPAAKVLWFQKLG